MDKKHFHESLALCESMTHFFSKYDTFINNNSSTKKYNLTLTIVIVVVVISVVFRLYITNADR